MRRKMASGARSCQPHLLDTLPSTAAAFVLLVVTLGGFSVIGRVSGTTVLVASEAAGRTVPAAIRDAAAGAWSTPASRRWRRSRSLPGPIAALGGRLDAAVSALRRRRWARGQQRQAHGRGPAGAALTIYVGAVFFFLILPTFVVVPLSLSAGDFLAFPPPGWSLRWYASYFGQAPWLQATLLSFEVALVTTLVSTVLGTLAAYGVLRGRL